MPIPLIAAALSAIAPQLAQKGEDRHRHQRCGR
jgi:hypothetical protein